MSLNIKNEKAHRLASELSGLLGVSMTQAIIAALEDKLSLLRRRKGTETTRFDELMAISRRAARHCPGKRKSLEDMLYDERGLPR